MATTNKFKFNIITGTDAQTKYDAITTKEPYTFYLLQTGIGYLGSTKLFDANDTSSGSTTNDHTYFDQVEFHTLTQAELNNNTFENEESSWTAGMTGIQFQGYNMAANETFYYFIPMSKYISGLENGIKSIVPHTLISSEVNASGWSYPGNSPSSGQVGWLCTTHQGNHIFFDTKSLNIARGKFFGGVSPHTITQAEINNSLYNGLHLYKHNPLGGTLKAGDTGLMFAIMSKSGLTGESDTVENYVFVPITTNMDVTGKFFRDVSPHTITQTEMNDSSITKATGTVVGDSGLMFIADNNETTDGDEKKMFVPVKVDVPDTVNTFTSTDTSSAKVPTVAAVVNYIATQLADKVTFEVDGVAGNTTGDGGLAFPTVYSETETRIGTWTDGKPLYRKIFIQKNLTPNDTSSFTLVTNIDSAVDTVTSLTGTVKTIANGVSIPLCPLQSINGNNALLQFNGSSIIYYCSSALYATNPVDITITMEYTKS